MLDSHDIDYQFDPNDCFSFSSKLKKIQNEIDYHSDDDYEKMIDEQNNHGSNEERINRQLDSEERDICFHGN